MKAELDRFSQQADAYLKYRPVYPDSFYHFIYSKVNKLDYALDCATGNGQVAVRLSERFKKVEAIDISEKQIVNALRKDNISYRISRSEATPFEENTFDLITVGQAIHWFDFDAFYTEVNRIARHSALLAVWGYGLVRVNDEVNKVVDKFYHEITHPFWDDERLHLDESYTTIPFPFVEIDVPPIELNANWKPNHLFGFFNSWSGVQNYIKKKGKNPVDLIRNDIANAWHEAEEIVVTFPMFCKFGIIEK